MSGTYDPVEPVYQGGIEAANGLTAIQEQIQKMVTQIAMISSMLATLNPMIACRLAAYEMGLIGQEQEEVQVALPAQELNVQNSMLEMVTLQQSLYNQLCAGSDGYYNSTQYGPAITSTTPGVTSTGNGTYTYDGQNYKTYTDPTTGDTYLENSSGTGYYEVNSSGQGYYVPINSDGTTGTPIACDTPQQQADYEQTMAQFNECSDDINTALQASFDEDSNYYGWLDVNTANSLWSNEQAIQAIIKPTSTDPNSASIQTQCANFSYQYACYTADPSSPTNPQGTPVNTDPSNGPVVNPDPYPVAQNVQILTQSFNTNISMMNSCTQATTGEIKTGTSETQQIYGSVKNMAQSAVQNNQTSVNNERTQ